MVCESLSWLGIAFFSSDIDKQEKLTLNRPRPHTKWEIQS